MGINRGIYCIKNLITEKLYIGSSVDIKRRWRDHRYSLKKGKSLLPKLQNTVNKHGIENFEFTILEHVSIHDILTKREQYWMDHYDSYNNGYNARPKAENNLNLKGINKGRVFSTEHRKNLSVSHKGNIPSNYFELGINELKKLYVTQSKSANEVSKIMGCSHSKVITTLKKHNLTRKKSERYKNHVIDVEKLRVLYENVDIPIKKISEIMGCSIFKIYDTLHKHKLCKFRHKFKNPY